MYLSQISKFICLNRLQLLPIAVKHSFHIAAQCQPALIPLLLYCICPNCNMYLSQFYNRFQQQPPPLLLTAFVQIAKCICLKFVTNFNNKLQNSNVWTLHAVQCQGFGGQLYINSWPQSWYFTYVHAVQSQHKLFVYFLCKVMSFVGVGSNAQCAPYIHITVRI